MRQTLTLGVGGGIVADSNANSEYDEALLKAAFVQRAAQPYQLIETMRAEQGSIPLLDAHLERFYASAALYDLGRYAEAKTAYESVLGQDLGGQEGRALEGLGVAARWLGDGVSALEAHEEAYRGYRQAGDGWEIAHTLSNLADVAQAEGKHAEARARHDRNGWPLLVRAGGRLVMKSNGHARSASAA